MTTTNGAPGADFIQSAKVQSPKSFLFTTLIKDLLGFNAALIIAKLYSNKRLSLKDLSLKTKLSKKKVKLILVSLIQLKCVKYSITGNQNSRNADVTYYVDEEGLLLLLYSGEIITLMKNKYKDELIAEIVQNFLTYGNLTLNDYLANFEGEDELKKLDVEKKIGVLVNDGWLEPIKSNLDFQDKYEIFNKLYQKNYSNYPKSTSISEIKRKREVRLDTEIEFSKLFTVEAQDVFESDSTKTSVTLNRFTSSKINAINDDDDDNSILRKIKKDLSFKFSLSRFCKSLRTKYLVKFISQRLGPLSAQIYELILTRIEKDSPECFSFALDFQCAHLTVDSKHENPDSTGDTPHKDMNHYLNYVKKVAEVDKRLCITVQDVLFMLKKSKNINLINSIKFKPLNSKKRKQNSALQGDDEPQAKKLKVKAEPSDPSISSLQNGGEANGETTPTQSNNNNNVDDDNDNEDDEDGEVDDLSNPHSAGLLLQHVELMTNDSLRFLKQKSNGTYYVPFAELIPALKRFTYTYLVKSALGLDEFKTLNCIIKSKLVDEKTLINTTLLNETVLRTAVNKLFKLQAIEVQEIPKTQDRQANRSSFAYRFNTKTSYNLIANNLLHEMALIFNNVLDVKERNKLLLSKANRDDIKGHETELLLTSELNQLKWLNEKELNCVGRIGRARNVWETLAIL